MRESGIGTFAARSVPLTFWEASAFQLAEFRGRGSGISARFDAIELPAPPPRVGRPCIALNRLLEIRLRGVGVGDCVYV